MSKTVAQAAADYRRRKNERLAKRTHALEAIVAKLEGNEKSLAVEISAIAVGGLS